MAFKFNPITGNLDLIGNGVLDTTTLTSFTSGSIIFAGSDLTLQENNSNLYWDDTNKRIGIQTGAPTDALHIFSDTNASITLEALAPGADSRTLFKRFRGSKVAKTIIQSGDQLGRWLAQGYDGAAYVTGGEISIEVDGTPGSSDMPGRIVFWTTPDGSASQLERMRITNAGFVGIGTNVPSSGLHVASTSALYPRGILTTQHSADTNSAMLHFQKSRGTNAAPTVIVTGDKISEVMFAGYDGSNYITSSMITAVSTGTIAATRLPSYMAFFTGTDAAPTVSTERMRILETGFVGIGTTTPLGLLHVSGNSSSTDISVFDGARSISIVNINQTNNSAAGLTLRTADSGGTIVTGGKINAVFTSHTAGAVSGDLAFSTNNAGTVSEKMRIMSSGNVGIGNTAPRYPLDIAGSTSSQVRIGSGTTDDGGFLLGSGTNGLYVMGGLIFNGAAFVAKSTSASMFVVVSGETRWYGNTGLTAGNTYGPTELMRLTFTGRLGINNNGAGAMLHVVSNASGTIVEIIKGAASQSADLTEWQNSAGTILGRVDASGFIGVGPTTPAAAALDITANSLYGIRSRGNNTGGTSSFGFYSNSTFYSDVTVSASSFQSTPSTTAASYTLSSGYGIFLSDWTLGAGSAITTQYGMRISDQTKGTTNYGIFNQVASGSNKWGYYGSGTALNYFAGNVGIGQTSATAVLHLKAGTSAASTAPLKLTSGTNMTAAETGAMEYDGTKLYFTPTTTVRKTIPMQVVGGAGQVALVAGTKAITITGVLTTSLAFVTLVIANTTTLTTTYQAVCTADTLTLRANVAAGTINIADISTLNYWVIEP